MLDNTLTENEFDLNKTIPAGFWIRVLAYFIDFLILLALVVGSMFVKSVWAYLLLLVPMILYKPLLEGLLGGTAGKLAIGLRVINPEGGHDRDRGRIRPQRDFPAADDTRSPDEGEDD